MASKCRSSFAATNSIFCVFCHRPKLDKHGKPEKCHKKEAKNKDRELYWVCDSCKLTEQDRTRTLEAALLLENLGINMAATPGTTVSVNATSDKHSRSLTVTMTRTRKTVDPAIPMPAPPTPPIPAVIPLPNVSEPVPAVEELHVCSCTSCTDRRKEEAELQKEIEELQKIWTSLRCAVRQMYREDLLKDGANSKGKKFDLENLRSTADRLCSRDAHQLYQRLESQGREFIMELKVHLLQLLISPENSDLLNADHEKPAASDKTSLASQISPNQATAFLRTLLSSFVKFQQTVRNMGLCFLQKLDSDHLSTFGVSWEIVNRHLFETLIYEDPLVQATLPRMLSQLEPPIDAVLTSNSSTDQRFGGDDDVTHAATSADAVPDSRLTSSDENSNNPNDTSLCLPLAELDREHILGAWPTFEKLMHSAKESWQSAEERIEEFTAEQMETYKANLKAKQRLLKKDLEFFQKQRRIVEEYVSSKKKAKSSDKSNSATAKVTKGTDTAAFTESLRGLLQSANRGAAVPHQKIPTQKCPNCKILCCPCDACVISHMIACGLITSDDDDLDLPLDEEELFRSLDQASLSLSGSSSENGTDDSSGEDNNNEPSFIPLTTKTAVVGECESVPSKDDGNALIASSLYNARESKTKNPTVQQHINNAYGEWEVSTDLSSRLLCRLAPCLNANKTERQQPPPTKKNGSITASKAGAKSTTTSSTANADSSKKQSLPAKLEEMLAKNELTITASGLCKTAEFFLTTEKKGTTPPTCTAKANRVRTQRQHSLTETLSAACESPKKKPSPDACATNIQTSDKDVAGNKEKPQTNGTAGSSPHSSNIPADILEMLKDEKLSKALSAAAKRVRSNGGGPQEFLLEAESIKKGLLNGAATAENASKANSAAQPPVGNDSTHATGDNKLSNGKDKEHSNVGTQVEDDDDDSWSERSELSSGGRHCDCCYCEVFGHAASQLTPTSQNYPQIRERLRRKLKQKQCELTQNQRTRPDGAEARVGCQKLAQPPVQAPAAPQKEKADTSIDKLLAFINGPDGKTDAPADEVGATEPSQKTIKNAKRQKQKQKKQQEDVKKKPLVERQDSSDYAASNDDVELVSNSVDRLKATPQVAAAANSVGKRASQSPKSLPKSATAVNAATSQNSQSLPKKSSQGSPSGAAAQPAKIAALLAETVADAKLQRDSKVKAETGGQKSVSTARPSSKESNAAKKQPAAPANTKSPAREKAKPNSANAGGRDSARISVLKKTPATSNGRAYSDHQFDEFCVDEVFNPKSDMDLDASDLDEADRDVEIFKRFVMDNAPSENRAKIKVNLNLGNILGSKASPVNAGKGMSAATGVC